METLTYKDLITIEESLQYSKLHFENHQSFPSYEHKIDKLRAVEQALEKIRALKKGA
jgi:hypothetical protein